MLHVPKLSDQGIKFKCLAVFVARFLKGVLLFWNIMHEKDRMRNLFFTLVDILLKRTGAEAAARGVL